MNIFILTGILQVSNPDGPNFMTSGLFVNNSYIWTSTDALITITNWAPNEPDGGDGKCIQMWKTHSWKLDDCPCWLPKGYICELKLH